MQTLGSQLSDAERFKDAEGLELICRNCKSSYTCSGLLMEKVSMLFDSDMNINLIRNGPKRIGTNMKHFVYGNV